MNDEQEYDPARDLREQLDYLLDTIFNDDSPDPEETEWCRKMLTIAGGFSCIRTGIHPYWDGWEMGEGGINLDDLAFAYRLLGYLDLTPKSHFIGHDDPTRS